MTEMSLRGGAGRHWLDFAWPVGASLRQLGLVMGLLWSSGLAVDAEDLEGGDKTSATFQDCEECPEMVMIRGGAFLMGSPLEEEGRYAHEGPVRHVTVSSFALGRYEVTRGEFARFVRETGHGTGACAYWIADFGNVRLGYDLDLHNPGRDHRQTDRHPVNCVSWDDARAYAEWLAIKTGKPYRLPSEAEWEYAARAGTSSRYFWGDDAGLACGYANGYDQIGERTHGFNIPALSCDDGNGLTAPVGSFGANAFSLFDMAGNLWEWVEDHYRKTYEGAPVDGSPWRSSADDARVLRGGSWENEPRALRAAHRIWSRPGSRLNSNGFRVALTLSGDHE